MATSEKKDDSQSNETTPKKAPVWNKRQEWQLPDLGDDGWYPLSLLLDCYAPGDLATAIEKYGIYTNDRHGRTIHCTLKDNAEQYEQALDLLADWQSELDDPGHVYSWDSEKYEVEAHPTEYWRLPDKVVKLLDEIKNNPNNEGEMIAKQLMTSGWTGVLQDKAKQILEQYGDCPVDPNFTKISRQLEKWAIEMSEKYDLDPPPKASTIRSHVVSRENWTDPIRKKLNKKPARG